MNSKQLSCKYFRSEYNHDLRIKNPPFKMEGESSSGYYLCIKTLTVDGPDHGPVGPENCQEGRDCYLRSK